MPKYGYQPDFQKNTGALPTPVYGTEPMSDQLGVLMALPGIRVEQLVYARRKTWGMRRYNHYLMYPLIEL
jgi:hypothetical protein